MNNILTAEEFGEFKLPRGIEWYSEFGEMMIEFAQLHVKAALDAAAESIECYPSEQVAIVTSYPLTNIK